MTEIKINMNDKDKAQRLLDFLSILDFVEVIETRGLIPPAERDVHVEREMNAYIRLHPELKQTHFGKHVAVYGGQLIDEDDDFGALFERIDAQYPDVFVWMTQVKEEPIETLHVCWPRVAGLHEGSMWGNDDFDEPLDNMAKDDYK